MKIKFFLVRYSGLAVVMGENERDALEHYSQAGHSVEWNSTHHVQSGPVEIDCENQEEGWWEAVKIFRERI